MAEIDNLLSTQRLEHRDGNVTTTNTNQELVLIKRGYVTGTLTAQNTGGSNAAIVELHAADENARTVLLLASATVAAGATASFDMAREPAGARTYFPYLAVRYRSASAGLATTVKFTATPTF